MKIELERVPQGVRVTVGRDGTAKPAVFTLTPNEIDSLTKLMWMAAKADAFTFSYEAKG